MDPPGRGSAAHAQRRPGPRAQAAAHSSAASGASAIGQVDIKVAGRGAVGKAGVRGAATCALDFGRRARDRGFLRAHHARRPHRHHRSQRLRQDDAHQASDGRARADGADRSTAEPRSSPRTSISSANQLDPAASIMDNVTARQRRHGDHRRPHAPRIRISARFSVSAGAAARAGRACCRAASATGCCSRSCSPSRAIFW